ncbi:YfcC family protein [Carnobacterium antarcticum]|uniref:YfcC family protein n=1 Tax=Carnobacterium antarcticum TaxID=2126436 RepID=A0ABW4NMV8_9LACT|nr:YfcC family protein [Carnobacterium sp. CP1]
MPSSFTVLFLIIVAIAILTWFIPAGSYDTDDAGNIIAGTYHTVESHPQGIWEVFMSPVKGMLGTDTTPGAIEVSLFIMVVGGFLGVVTKTGALDAGIASIVKAYKGKEKKLIPVLMLIFAIGGTTFGMGEETLAFYPLILPVMVGVGFDTLVAVAIVLVGSQIGVLASTVNPFATGVASQALGISPGEGIIWRLILFIVLYAASTFYVYRYAVKVEKDPDASFVAEQKEKNIDHFKIHESQKELDARQKNVMILFALTFFIMILGLVPWTSLNQNWTFFERFNSFLVDIPVVGSLLGAGMVPLGEWYFQEITMLFFLMAVIIGLLYRLPEGEIVDAFMDGAKDLLSVALVVAIARGIQVVMNDGMITATVLHWGEEGLSGLSPVFFTILTYIFYIPMSFLIPSTSGLAAATMGIMGPLGGFSGVPQHLVITAYQSASGIINLITPTSGVVMGALAIARIDLSTWWKFMAKLIALVFILTCVILGIAAVFS